MLALAQDLTRGLTNCAPKSGSADVNRPLAECHQTPGKRFSASVFTASALAVKQGTWESRWSIHHEPDGDCRKRPTTWRPKVG